MAFVFWYVNQPLPSNWASQLSWKPGAGLAGFSKGGGVGLKACFIVLQLSDFSMRSCSRRSMLSTMTTLPLKPDRSSQTREVVAQGAAEVVPVASW